MPTDKEKEAKELEELNERFADVKNFITSISAYCNISVEIILMVKK
ncbi:MAG: hypothetical protein KAU06_03675 [Candidatus Marinimicrobia bacterium]|nr:hypothetical protein [Candidatus Neomarinimicrobiota bacterium]